MLMCRCADELLTFYMRTTLNTRDSVKKIQVQIHPVMTKQCQAQPYHIDRKKTNKAKVTTTLNKPWTLDMMTRQIRALDQQIPLMAICRMNWYVKNHLACCLGKRDLNTLVRSTS